MRKKGIRQYYFFKLLGSYLLILFLVLTGAFSMFFYYLISAKTEELALSTSQSLEMAAKSMDALYEQTSQIGTSLLNNRTVNQFFLLDNTTPEMDYEVLTYIKTLQNAYPFIHSILLYQNDNNRILSSLHGYTLNEAAALRADLKFAASDRAYYKVLSIPALQANARKQEDVVGFIYNPIAGNNHDVKKSVVILIKKEELETMLQPLSLTSGQSFYLMDSIGNIVLSSPADTQTAVKVDLFAQGGEADFPAGAGESAYSFHANTQLLDWQLILLSDPSSPLAGLQDILFLLFLFSAILLTVGITASLLFARHLYSPLKSLLGRATEAFHPPIKSGSSMNEYDYIETYFAALTEKSKSLESVAEATAPYMHEMLYRKLVENNCSKLEQQQSLKLPHAEKRKHRIVLVSMDVFVQPSDISHTMSSFSVEYYAIQNMLHELFMKQYLVTSFRYDRNTIVLFLSCDTDLETGDIQTVLHKAQDIFQQHFQMTFSAAIGRMTAYAQLHMSMEEARRTLCNRFLQGENTVCIAKANSVSPSARFFDQSAEYAEKIIGVVGNEEAFTHEISIFFKYLAENDVNHCLYSLRSVLLDLKKQFKKLYPSLFDRKSEFFLLFEAPEEMITLDRVKSMLLSWNNQIMLEQYEMISTRNEHFISEIKKYVEQNYSNPTLNTDLIAGNMHFSSGYIRKLFKSQTGMGISEYIMNTRLDEAKRLLLTTNLTATVICEQIGLYNNTYFSTLFKKRFGTTPISYRQMMLLNDEEKMK